MDDQGEQLAVLAHFAFKKEGECKLKGGLQVLPLFYSGDCGPIQRSNSSAARKLTKVYSILFQTKKLVLAQDRPNRYDIFKNIGESVKKALNRREEAVSRVSSIVAVGDKNYFSATLHMQSLLEPFDWRTFGHYTTVGQKNKDDVKQHHCTHNTHK